MSQARDIPGIAWRCTRVAVGALAALSLLACTESSQFKKSPDAAADYNLQLGVAYLQRGNLNVAKEKLERALKLAPRDPNVHSAMALLSERLGRPRQVDEHYRTALRLAPGNPDISNNYAVYLCRSGRYDEGVERFLDAARNPLYRTPEAAYTNAGVCLRSAKREDDAAQSLRRALELRPNFAEAAYQLADLELQRGRVKEAREQVDRYLGAFNATPELLLIGVRTARSQGDRAALERYARQLRTDFPQSEQTRAMLELLRTPSG